MSEWADLIADPDTFELLALSRDTVAAGRCTIGGRPVVLAWFDFSHHAGTLSRAAGEAFATAVDVAAAEQRPLVGIANSGGARMQEGTLAFLQMLKIQAALVAFGELGGCSVVYLAHPTTGGVFASWATAGDVTFAEPGATLAFTGPRVAAALGTPIEPASVQTAEGHYEAGHVDALVARADLREALTETLAAMAPEATVARGPSAVGPIGRVEAPVGAAVTARRDLVDPALRLDPASIDMPRGWAAVAVARDLPHGDTLAALRDLATHEVELRGDRMGGRDDAVYVGVLRVDGRRLLVVAHRPPGPTARLPTAVGLRTARRGLAIADRLGIPVVSIVDAEGVELSADTEIEGMAGEISASVRAWLDLSVPSVALLAGSGSGGGALAWLAADAVIARPESWVAPISPEAAAAIVHRDVSRAAEMADLHRGSAAELYDAGVIDAIVAGADLADVAVRSIEALSTESAADRRAFRLARYRRIADTAD